MAKQLHTALLGIVHNCNFQGNKRQDELTNTSDKKVCFIRTHKVILCPSCSLLKKRLPMKHYIQKKCEKVGKYEMD